MVVVSMASLKLMIKGSLESADELEDSLFSSYISLQSQLAPPYHLSTLTPAQHSHLTQALLFGILSSPSAALSHVTHLTAVTTDGYASFVTILLRLVNESYPKLLEQTRTQIIWLFKQLIDLTAVEVDAVFLSLLRQVGGGDLSPGNVWLAAQLLEIMQSNWSWVSASPQLFTTALYTYLRLLPDHAMAKGPTFNELKENETSFCVQILRDRFQDCLVIGRDLIRLLQDVTFIPDFEAIWRDLLCNPTSFKALAFADIAQLYLIRTPTRYITSRVTPDMESQIRFMLTHVKMGCQRRYQTWFAQRFLSSPESETLVCDLIRFICCVHHPTNQILQSDIVPRWAIVGWLLKCCKTNHVEANAKLALFYDWLFFMSKADNIMNIEPAILLMVYSIPKYVDMTHSLLEFLFLVLEHYDPVRKDLILKGVTASVDILVGKGVVRSLEPLSACTLVASWLREKLVSYFSAYCRSDLVDGFKHVRPELMQQDGPYESIQTQISGVIVSKSNHSLVSRTSAGRELGVEWDGNLVARQTHHSDSVMEDSKSGEVDSLKRKRRRFGVPESLLCETQLCFERLAEALTRSQDAGLLLLERLVLSYLSVADQLYCEKVSKDFTLTRIETGGEALTSSGEASLGPDCTTFSATKFATQVTEILKKAGYELFCPLHKLPSDRPEGDETMSLTSTLLRLYIANCGTQPQLLQLLLSWHKEGLAVGPRLLCYVSRLAEEIDPATGSSSKGPTTTANLDSEVFVGHLGRSEGASHDTGMNVDEEGAGEFVEGSGESIRECQKNGFTGTSSLKLYGPSNYQPFSRKMITAKDLNPTVDMHTQLRAAVTNAFKAYEEFLKIANKGSFILASESSGSSAVQCSEDSLLDTQMRVETAVLDGSRADAELLSDLETCLLWNTNRFLRVLPSVFRYLPMLSTGRDEIVHLLVSTLDPQVLSNFEFSLLLGEFVILGDHQESLLRSIKASLRWEFIEQQFFWRLLVAELQAAPSSVVMQVIKICASLLNPQANCEAQSGLLLLLRYRVPTLQLVHAVLSLPPMFGKFAAVVLASWVSSHHSQLLSCLQNLNTGSPKERQKKGAEDAEGTGGNRLRRLSSSAVLVLLNSLDDTACTRSNTEEKSARMIHAAEIKRALVKLAGAYGIAGVGSLQGQSETAFENHQERKLL